MQVLDIGHRYQLENFEAKDKPGQVLQFIKKEPQPAGDGSMYTVNDGTTNEEVLKVLVDRLNNLNSKFPCRENSIAITHLETALLWLEKRTSDRKLRGVEGRHIA